MEIGVNPCAFSCVSTHGKPTATPQRQASRTPEQSGISVGRTTPEVSGTSHEGNVMKQLRGIRYLVVLVPILLLAVSPYATAAPVTRTGTVTTIQNSLQSDSQSVTVPTDATLCVVMATLYNGTANWIAPNPVSLGGTNLTTLQKTDEQTDNGHVWLGYLVNPATGSQTLAWDWGATPSVGANIAVSFYKGVVTTNPVV